MSRSNLAAKRPSWTSCASQKTTKTWASSCNGQVGVGVSSLFILVYAGRTVRYVYFPYRFKLGLLSQSNWFEHAFLLSMCLDDVVLTLPLYICHYDPCMKSFETQVATIPSRTCMNPCWARTANWGSNQTSCWWPDPVWGTRCIPCKKLRPKVWVLTTVYFTDPPRCLSFFSPGPIWTAPGPLLWAPALKVLLLLRIMLWWHDTTACTTAIVLPAILLHVILLLLHVNTVPS